MKKLLLSSALLAVCSMSAMDQDNFKLRLATSEENISPDMHMGIAVYNGMIDKLKVSEDMKERLKGISAHKGGYVQAMVNAGNPKWPFVQIERENGSPVGFAALELVEQPQKAIALHILAVNQPALYMRVAPLLIQFIKQQFPDKTSLVTNLGKDSFMGGGSALKDMAVELGFKPCDDYTPNPQVIWDPKLYDSYKKPLVEEAKPWDGRGISPALMEVLQQEARANDGKYWSNAK